MKTKHIKLIPLLTCIICTVFCYYGYGQESKEHRTIVSGYIPSYKDSIAEVRVILISDSGDNSMTSRYNHSTKLTNGYFSLEIPINEVKSIILYLNGKNLLVAKGKFVPTRTYLTPGDNIYLDVNDYGINNIRCSGKGCEKMELIRTLHNWVTSPKISHLSFGEPWVKRAKHTFDRIDSLEILINEYIGIIDNQSLTMLRSYYITMNLEGLLRSIAYRDPLDPDIKEAYKLLLAKKHVFDILTQRTPKEALQIHNLDLNLHDLAYFLIAHQEGKPRIGKPDPKKMYKFLSEMYHDKPIKNYLLYSFLYRFILKYNLTDGIEECIEDFLSHITKDDLQYTRLNIPTNHQYLKGKPAMNFALADTSGNMHNLDDFKNKVMVIDFWFTGCIGCIQTAKLLHEIEEMYKGKDVIFISVSIDKMIKQWKNGIGKASSKSSLQLYTNGLGKEHPFVLENQVYSYPTLTIIDKHGRYIYNKAPDPRAEVTTFLNIINLALSEK